MTLFSENSVWRDNKVREKKNDEEGNEK